MGILPMREQTGGDSKAAIRGRLLFCSGWKPEPPLFFVLVVAFCSAAPVAAGAPVIDEAWGEFRRELVIESLGLFWIAAELAILFCMGVAVRMFAGRPVPQRLALTASERRRALAWCAAFGTLALIVYVRHFIVPPLPHAVESIAETSQQVVQDARAAYLARANLHAGLWCAFVVGWVALEIAIVAQGVRAYGRLAELVAESRHAA